MGKVDRMQSVEAHPPLSFGAIHEVGESGLISERYVEHIEGISFNDLGVFAGAVLRTDAERAKVIAATH